MKDWYERQHELEPEQVFCIHDETIVKLDRRVPGDGTKWYVQTWSHGSWGCYDDTIEPSDLIQRVADPAET